VSDSAKPRRGILSLIGPGLLVAATGVGAGDLATAGFAGSKLGPAILWAVVLGAFLKFVLNEGLARWQIATGETILEGALTRFGRIAQIIFLIYLLAWSVFVGAALMSACGATTRAIIPLSDPKTGKIVFGMLLSIVGVVLVVAGGFKLFERVMAACIALMFVIVVVTAAMTAPDWGAVVSGLIVPIIPQLDGDGLAWSIALIGGVGGTLTIICYGYWMREQGRDRTAPDAMRITRIDIGVGYLMTAVFGVAMIIIASGIELTSGGGTALIIELSNVLGDRLGPAFRWLFLIGAWGAVFSSLLGVWQAVPYVFADFCRIIGRDRAPVDTRGKAYRTYLLFIAIVPMAGLFISFSAVQKYYAVFGALFIPLVAVSLLVLNRPKLVGERYRNRRLTIGVLIAAVLLAVVAGAFDVRDRFGF